MTLMTFGIYMMAERGPKDSFEERYAQSEAFCVLTSLQLLQGFLSRTMRTSVFKNNPTSNRWMIAGVALSFILMLMGDYVPGLNHDILTLEPVGGMTWVKILVCCVIQVIVSEAVKFVLRKTKAVI
jgi:Ca2+-transporting ATPase